MRDFEVNYVLNDLTTRYEIVHSENEQLEERDILTYIIARISCSENGLYQLREWFISDDNILEIIPYNIAIRFESIIEVAVEEKEVE